MKDWQLGAGDECQLNNDSETHNSSTVKLSETELKKRIIDFHKINDKVFLDTNMCGMLLSTLIVLYYNVLTQEAQLSQRGRVMPCVVEYFG